MSVQNEATVMNIAASYGSRLDWIATPRDTMTRPALSVRVIDEALADSIVSPTAPTTQAIAPIATSAHSRSFRRELKRAETLSAAWLCPPIPPPMSAGRGALG